MIGVAYFQWADEDLTGRGHDGEIYNCGLVDVTGRPYPYKADAIRSTSERIFRVHKKELDPVHVYPKRYVSYERPSEPW